MEDLPEKEKLTEMLEQDMADLLAFPEKDIMRIRVKRVRALELTSIILKGFKDLVPILPKELEGEVRVPERTQDYENLKRFAQVYYAADNEAEQPWTPAQIAERNRLAPIVHKHDQKYFRLAMAYIGDDEEAIPILVQIQSGHGRLDDADDTVKLINILRKLPEEYLVGPMDPKVMDQAEEEATALINLIKAAETEDHGTPADIRRRAYSRWYRTYMEIHALGHYLCRGDKDLDVRFPAISPERTSTASKDKEPPESPSFGS